MEKKLRGFEHQVLLKLVREIRKNKGLKQQELANRLGEPQSFISKYESGERRLDVLELKQLLDAMQIPFAKFAKILELRLKDGKYQKGNRLKNDKKRKIKSNTE